MRAHRSVWEIVALEIRPAMDQLCSMFEPDSVPRLASNLPTPAAMEASDLRWLTPTLKVAIARTLNRLEGPRQAGRPPVRWVYAGIELALVFDIAHQLRTGARDQSRRDSKLEMVRSCSPALSSASHSAHRSCTTTTSEERPLGQTGSR